MKLNPYLSFNGECEAAFKFYEQCLGGQIEGMMRWGESPMAEQVSLEWQHKIMHVQLTVGDQELMGSDSPTEQFEQPKGFSVLIYVEDSAKAEQVFQSLAENGTVKMPIQETFWAARFGMLVDQFGIPWMINCDKAA
ncbi:PhnB protein; putative DNA binding 3-demethylubiquinone-9 3-methyltransferase domain protein [uncultured Synechococcales cyanobacterium]|uniref:PhnB protein putative DNA binding 3-demethylubiquinone-9 3-methyltransferase domain protein n=1 Tax=uncultured Synechococcales cyanobacterium TaxID=1936017 RepID=A0A6J4UZK1_9CYAN|nr:PhnB protein; putative DNA binding 3-demethylubiquinone-9 3-methyltransferase domain protein [uncultured Synechococcales cyanobacterium]